MVGECTGDLASTELAANFFRIAVNLRATANNEGNLMATGRQRSKQVGSASVKAQPMADHTKDETRQNFTL
jgi:hypothetical protein